MGEMTKDEINVALFDENKRLKARIEKLEKMLASAIDTDWLEEDE